MNSNESAEMTMTSSKESDKSLGRVDFMDELTLRESHNDHKKYGNMKVLLETQNVLITLGPDYPCFLISFICFLVADYFLVTLVNQAFQSYIVKAVNIVIVVLQIVSYLSVAVSNPGIALQQNMPSEQTVQSQESPHKRYCLKCKIRMFKSTYHCKSCDVCIRNYDHHCPWVSKCIGGSNVKRFYFFVSITPIYIMYFVIVLMISLAVTTGGKSTQ